MSVARSTIEWLWERADDYSDGRWEASADGVEWSADFHVTDKRLPPSD
jgi:hypothetical protein